MKTKVNQKHLPLTICDFIFVQHVRLCEKIARTCCGRKMAADWSLKTCPVFSWAPVWARWINIWSAECASNCFTQCNMSIPTFLQHFKKSTLGHTLVKQGKVCTFCHPAGDAMTGAYSRTLPLHLSLRMCSGMTNFLAALPKDFCK